MHPIALNLSCYIMRKKGSGVAQEFMGLSQESTALGGSKLEGGSFRGALF